MSFQDSRLRDERDSWPRAPDGYLMATIYWANLLHFYQPPIQLPEVLRKIVDESYRPLIDVFEQHPQAKASVNINGVTTEMLYESGYQDVIDGLRGLAERGQIEFVGS